MRHFAVIPAAGVGSRMESAVPKQYLMLQGRTLLEHVLLRLGGHPRIDAIVVAVNPADPFWPRQTLPDLKKEFRIAAGGAERCQSVLNALERLADLAHDDDWVLVHDAARPCLHPDDIDRLLDRLSDSSVGGLLAVPVTDTLKRGETDQRVIETVPREGLWRAMTPQMFRYGLLRNALRAAIAAGVMVTDEAAAIERAGHVPLLVEGRADNIKITRPEDLALAELFMAAQEDT